MTVDLLARLGARDAATVTDQIRAAHSELPREKCMAWRHAMRFPGKEGGCDIHPTEEA